MHHRLKHFELRRKFGQQIQHFIFQFGSLHRHPAPQLNLNLAHQTSQEPRRFSLQALPIVIVTIENVRAGMAAQLLRHSRIAVACI